MHKSIKKKYMSHLLFALKLNKVKSIESNNLKKINKQYESFKMKNA